MPGREAPSYPGLKPMGLGSHAHSRLLPKSSHPLPPPPHLKIYKPLSKSNPLSPIYSVKHSRCSSPHSALPLSAPKATHTCPPPQFRAVFEFAPGCYENILTPAKQLCACQGSSPCLLYSSILHDTNPMSGLPERSVNTPGLTGPKVHAGTVAVPWSFSAAGPR